MYNPCVVDLFLCSYCLTGEDTSLDAKLTRIQQRYLGSESISNCSAVNTLNKVGSNRKRKLSLGPQNEPGQEVKSAIKATGRKELKKGKDVESGRNRKAGIDDAVPILERVISVSLANEKAGSPLPQNLDNQLQNRSKCTLIGNTLSQKSVGKEHPSLSQSLRRSPRFSRNKLKPTTETSKTACINTGREEDERQTTSQKPEKQFPKKEKRSERHKRVSLSDLINAHTRFIPCVSLVIRRDWNK